jgi:hypothetical protein
MFIPDSGSRFLSIPDLTATKEEGLKKFWVNFFFVAKNIAKFNIFLFLNWKRKKFEQFEKNYSTFYPKNCH